MLQFLESPVIMWSIITLFILLFFILFLTMLPRTNWELQIGTDILMRVAEENRSECTMLGFLEKLPKGDPIPNECLSCRKLVKCVMAKRAFEWYTGQNSKNERTNWTKTSKYIQE